MLPDRSVLKGQKISEKCQNGQDGQNSPKLTIFGIFNELLATQNVNVMLNETFLGFSNTVPKACLAEGQIVL